MFPSPANIEPLSTVRLAQLQSSSQSLVELVSSTSASRITRSLRSIKQMRSVSDVFLASFSQALAAPAEEASLRLLRYLKLQCLTGVSTSQCWNFNAISVLRYNRLDTYDSPRENKKSLRARKYSQGRNVTSAVPPTLTKTHFGILVLSLRITVAIRATLLKSDPLQLPPHWDPLFRAPAPRCYSH